LQTSKKTPMRQCLGCRAMKPKDQLIRIVKSPDGAITADPAKKKPGRGAYLCRSADCLSRAVKSKAFSRAFHAPIPQEVFDALKEQMEQTEGNATNGT
jgi:predicted RNA-binding protein YlxR (DUF448 family)